MQAAALLTLVAALTLGGTAAADEGTCPHHHGRPAAAAGAPAESHASGCPHHGADSSGAADHAGHPGGCPHHAAQAPDGEAHAAHAGGCPHHAAQAPDGEGHATHAAGCPHRASHAAGAAHSDHHAAVDARGDREMGFSHARTTHHFRLRPEGGIIEVEVAEPTDVETLAAVRSHLAEIARLFAAGDFAKPAAIHARTVPGTETLVALRGEITYRFEETPRGAQVWIATENPEALAAVHEFLRFQIADHRTGDPLTASP